MKTQHVHATKTAHKSATEETKTPMKSKPVHATKTVHSHATEESETAMKTKPVHATKTAHHSATHESETPMKTTHAHSKKPAVPTASVEESEIAMTPNATASATSATTPNATGTSTALPYVKAPPPITLPAVPSGIVTTSVPADRAQLPRKQELQLMPDVQTELQRFTDFDVVFGKTAPSQSAVEQTLTVAYQWSMLRIQLAAWVKYALSQEIPAWINSRAVIARLAPAFKLAVTTDSTVGVNYPSLGSLFGVRAAIAHRASATRKANEAQAAAGLPAYKGVTGKKRMTKAAKAALAAQEAASKASSQQGEGTAAPGPVQAVASPPAAPPSAQPVGTAPVLSLVPAQPAANATTAPHP
jgi:hypothetical protein